MKILLTADPEIPVPPKLYGGIERIIDALVRQYGKRGHTVGLVAHPESETPANQLFPWPEAPARSLPHHWRNLNHLNRVLREFSPEVVHSFSRILYMSRFLGSPTPKFMSYQRQPSPRTVKLGACLGRGNLTFTGCSEHIAAAGRASAGDWVAIPNFVEIDRLHFAPSVPEDAPLVFLSRIERIKGAHTAIEACRRAGRKLLIAGNTVSSEEGQLYWKNEIEPNLEPGRIEYVGAVDDQQKNELLGRAAAMIVPIEWEEPFGIVFAEALACGTPVIATPRGSVPEIVKHGEHGFHVRSADEAAEAIHRLPEIARAACRERAEALYTADAVAEAYLALYQSRLNGADRSTAGATA